MHHAPRPCVCRRRSSSSTARAGRSRVWRRRDDRHRPDRGRRAGGDRLRRVTRRYAPGLRQRNNALYELDLGDEGPPRLKVAGEELTAANQEGRIVRQLQAPRYAPDGSTIAFGLAGVNLIASGASTTAELVLPSSPYPDLNQGPPQQAVRFFWPGKWSPDGTKLLVEFAYFPEAGGLVILNLETNALTEITGQDDTTVICCEATWRGDGHAIYLASNFLAPEHPASHSLTWPPD